MTRGGFVYIMTNKNRTTLYVGVTNDLHRRTYEHANHLMKGSFTDRYNLEDCIYFERFPPIQLAITREKELKKWSRKKKEDLINKKNPEWKAIVTSGDPVSNYVPFNQQVLDVLNKIKEEVNDTGDSSLCSE